jgi:hypothetical protein
MEYIYHTYIYGRVAKNLAGLEIDDSSPQYHHVLAYVDIYHMTVQLMDCV